MKRDIKYIIRRVITGLILGFIFFNLNKCDVHAYVHVRNASPILDFNPTETSQLLNLTGTWSNGYHINSGSPWTYDIGEYTYYNGGGSGVYLGVSASYYFGIEANTVYTPANTVTFYGNNPSRNTITSDNLRCGFGNYGSYDSSYPQQVSNFSFVEEKGASSTSEYHYRYHIMFNYRQQIPNHTGGGNFSCWFYRPTTNYLALQSISNNSYTEYFGYTDIFDISLSADPSAQFYNQITNQNERIINQNTQINSNIVDIEDAIKDDSIDDPTSKINDAKNKVATNSTISSLVTLPVTLFTQVLNSLEGTCSTYTLGTLYEHTIQFECIDIGSVLGSGLWTTIDILISGLLVYAISRKFVKVFNELSQLKEGDIID